MTPSSPAPVRAIGVGVPARDEEGSIGACIEALDAAAPAVAVPVRVVVVADGCRDATARRAATALAAARHLTGRVVATGPVGVGRARTLALDSALADLAIDPAAAWLATTDADTCVAPSWLRAQCRWAAAGYDAVTGLVDVAWADASGPDGEIARRYRPSLQPHGVAHGHGHVHGANLGVRGSWWTAVGGCGDGHCGEDHELWARLRRAGARAVGVDDVSVTTSGRLTSRVEGGFATYLSALAGPAATPTGASMP